MPRQTVRELMTTEPAFCTPQTPIHDVARLMLENDCGSIPVVDNEQSRRVVGIITDRDIVCRVVAKDIAPSAAMVHQAMSAEVATLSPDARIDECVRLMASRQVRRVPVVERDGRLLGILAQADLARASANERQLEDELAELVEEVSDAARA